MRKLGSIILFRKRWTCLIAVILIIAVGGIIYKVRKPTNNATKSVTQQSQDDKVAEQKSDSTNPNVESQQAKQTDQSDTQKTKETSKNMISDNTKVYYVPGHKVYHLNRNDATIKGIKDVKTMTLKEAKEKGMKVYNSHS